MACLLPRVWVWGFWFGFALRRVALLCGVFVHLHLALFPAGGPFLPSLSVNLYTYIILKLLFPRDFCIRLIFVGTLHDGRRCQVNTNTTN
jgi:hypothetical protein